MFDSSVSGPKYIIEIRRLPRLPVSALSDVCMVVLSANLRLRAAIEPALNPLIPVRIAPQAQSL